MAGRMVREARRRANLTQRQLSAKAGIPQETIARIERGRVDPRVATLDRLLEACGYGLESMPRLGIGIDRTQIQALLELPTDRKTRSRHGRRRALRRLATPAAPGRRVSEHPAFSADRILGGTDRRRRPLRPHRWPRGPGARLAIAHRRPRHLLRSRHGNLERLAAALTELAAVRRGLPADAPQMPPLDARTLRAGGRLHADDQSAGISTCSPRPTRDSTTSVFEHPRFDDRSPAIRCWVASLAT